MTWSRIPSLPLQMFSQVTTNHPRWSAHSYSPTQFPTPQTPTPEAATCQGPPSCPFSLERAQRGSDMAFLPPGKLDLEVGFPWLKFWQGRGLWRRGKEIAVLNAKSKHEAVSETQLCGLSKKSVLHSHSWFVALVGRSGHTIPVFYNTFQDSFMLSSHRQIFDFQGQIFTSSLPC